MGMEQAVIFPSCSPQCWPAARDLLTRHGVVVQVRMIDGELAFPDEEPADNWRELRLGTPEGLMVTVRRETDRIVLVAWGNADARLIEFWNRLAWAFGEAGHGQIDTAEGSHTPGE